MASYDRQFAVIQPSLDRLVRKPLEVADPRLLDPTNDAVVSLIDGEFVTMDANYKWVRATDPDKLAFAAIEDRGDYGVQASRKLSVLYLGSYEADTIVFDTALTTLGAAVKIGTVNNSNSGSKNRSGLIAHGGSNLVLGYITRVAANNGGLLRFIQTQV